MRQALPGVASKLAHGRDVGDFLGVGVEGKVLGDLPQEDLAIFGGGSDEAIVEGVPGSRELMLAVA